MSVYTIDEVRDKLMPLSDAQERLGFTEPLDTKSLSSHERSRVRFRLTPGWNHELDAADGLSLVDAYLTLDDQEYQLTKDAALEASSAVGLPKAYTVRAPAALIEPQLNWWYQEGRLTTEYKAMMTQGHIVALNKASILPFSNLQLVDAVLGGIQDKYGNGEVLVDKKFNHSLRSTIVRIVVPEKQRIIERTGTDNDSWSVGVEIRNSLVGEHPTSIEGYLFRYWCTNGCTDTHASSGTWSRRAGQGGEVYEWARAAVDGVLGGLEHSLDDVQLMADTSIQGETVDVLRDMFEQYKIPVPQRDSIINSMVDETNLTMYSLMQAVTSAANAPDLDPVLVNRLMMVGGDLPHAVSGRCESCRRLMPSA